METQNSETKEIAASELVSSAETRESKPTKVNWTKIGLIALIIAAIVLIIVLVLIITKPKATQEILNITYSIELENGTVLDSGTKEFTKGTIASNLNLATSKLDEELKNAAVGETKTIILEAKDAYGEYDEKKVYNHERITKENRSMEVNRTNWIAKNYFFNVFNEQPELNKVYQIEGAPWPYKVIELNESHVKLNQEPTLNQKIPFGLFNYKVIEITGEKIKLRLEGNDTVIPTANGNLEIKFTENETIITLTPEIGQEVQLEQLPKARVVGMNATHLFLDANHPLAGKKIVVKIIINNIHKVKVSGTTGAATQISGAPTLQVFIMSYCPFGIQALKGLLPVWEKFQGKANIELRFVSYIMHGQKEEEENKRMICIREEQSSKLLPYLKCFVEAGDSSGCLKKAGIDENKLNNCMSSKASQYMEEDKELNEKYGVQGSPTFILDGKEANIYPRDPQSIATSICNAFKGSKPAVCSEKFSTENPSPGFGSGT
ncbi:MAG: hypothetical protein N3G19_02170, partial [Candidatus Pacearchaeota archaeon]|nr:hypothetical protein [Candidatus Pacearchaeota archaeon]